jgi:hypothetical protein
MKIKKIKEGHVTNCQYCKVEGNKVQAIYHLTGENKQSCEKHLIELKQIQTLSIADDGGYRTEADYQTWMRL